MDPAGVTATQKTLDAIRSAPAWLLIGLSVSVLSVWIWPPFFDSLPEAARSVMPIMGAVATILAGCKIADVVLQQWRESRGRSLRRDRQRLAKLYAPLASLFLDQHVIGATGIGAPHLRQRIENALEEFTAHRRWPARLKCAWRALFDQQISSSAEVDYGGDFPMSHILSLVRREPQRLDAALYDLVRRADRSRRDDPGRSFMTDEELELSQHIIEEFHRLSARIG